MEIKRLVDLQELKRHIGVFPVTAILGARQCGKTTLARQIKYNHYFDLENPRDLAKFENPQLLLEGLSGTIIIDEIQRSPDLFPLIRYLVDTVKKQKYVILGSASRDLIQHGSETLAGRIGFLELSGFGIHDIGAMNFKTLWTRGGLPRSYLAGSDEESMLWRENYITTFLERDIPQLGITIPAHTLRRFWTMLGTYHGQLVNYSEIGRAFGISDMTVRNYIGILAGTFMVRVLSPWYSNIGKRLVKSPKVYIRDTGLLHALLSIQDMDQLLSHGRLGASWEGFALETVCRSIGKRNEEVYFFKTHAGSELDLFWQEGGKNWGVEFKYADAPGMTRSMKSVMDDLALERLWVVYPGKDRYALEERITVIPPADIGERWNYR
ncbi:MAG: ATP-binding protein [Spirochaetes bacterium]|jgi:hypothetical protein|nr:ATP-binding protein [Spirochaetota bacterium]